MKHKINKIGKICHVLAVILTVLTIIGGAFCLIGGCVLCAVPQDAFTAELSGDAAIKVSGSWIDAIPSDTLDETLNNIRTGSMDYSVNGQKVIDGERTNGALILKTSGSVRQFTLGRVGIMLLMSAVGCGLLAYVFITLAKLMKEMQNCESPFTEKVVKAMTNFAISLIPYALLKPTLDSFSGSFLTGGDFDFHFGVDLTTAFAALIVILLIVIFKYGVQLQAQADETL